MINVVSISTSINHLRHKAGLLLCSTKFAFPSASFQQFLKTLADGTSIILDGFADSPNETSHILTDYASISGLKVNFEQTKLA